MRPVTDELLLNLATIAATLLGLLVVGVLFYVETGLRRLSAYEAFAPYVRAAARLTMGLYVVSLATAIALVALTATWSRLVFGVTGLAVLASLVGFTRRAQVIGRLIGPGAWSRSHELVIWACVVAALTLPWILGGLTPDREDLAWGVLQMLALGLLSTLNLLLSIFDIAKYEHPPARERV